MRIAFSTLELAAVCALFAAGCGDSSGTGGAGGSATSVTSATHATVASSTTATTAIASTGDTSSTGGGGTPTITMTLSADTVAAGSSVTGTVTVTNFILEAPVNQPNQAGHGHYHVYLDGASGGNYLVADQVPSVQIKIPANTTAGAHTLRVSLSDNHHTPLTPAVEDTVDITVQ